MPERKSQPRIRSPAHQPEEDLFAACHQSRSPPTLLYICCVFLLQARLIKVYSYSLPLLASLVNYEFC